MTTVVNIMLVCAGILIILLVTILSLCIITGIVFMFKEVFLKLVKEKWSEK